MGDALYTHAPDALAAGHAMYRGPFLAASKRPCVQEREEDMAMCAACTHPISPSAVEQGRASILSADAMSTICPDVRSAVGEGGAAVWTDAVAVFLCTSAATCKKHALEARVSPPTEIPAHCVWKKAWRAAALEVIPEPAVKFDAHIWFEDVHDLSNSSLRAKRKRDSELPEDKILRLVKSAHTSRTCETSGHELFEASVDAAAAPRPEGGLSEDELDAEAGGKAAPGVDQVGVAGGDASAPAVVEGEDTGAGTLPPSFKAEAAKAASEKAAAEKAAAGKEAADAEEAPPADRKRQRGSSVTEEEEELGGGERLLELLVRKKHDTDAANEKMRERVNAEMAAKMATGVIPNPLLRSIQAKGEVGGEVEGEARMVLAPDVARDVPMSWSVEYGSEKDAEAAWPKARDEVGGEDTPMGDVVVSIATTLDNSKCAEFKLDRTYGRPQRRYTRPPTEMVIWSGTCSRRPFSPSRGEASSRRRMRIARAW